MVAMFLLGFVMDAFEIIFVVVPIVRRALLKLPGVDPVWLGVMMAMNLQTSVHAPAARADAVLPARRGPAGDHHPAHLSSASSRSCDPALRAGGAVVRAGACDRAAAMALWEVMKDSDMKAAEIFDLKGRVAHGHRRVERAGRALRRRCWRRTARRSRWWRAGPTGSKDVQRQIEQAGGKAIAVEADVLDRAPMTRAFDQAEKALGTVTILVNNAGVAHSDPRDRCHRRGMAPRRRHQSRRGVLLGAGGGAAHARRRQERRDRQHRLGARLRRVEGHRRLCDRQGGRDPAHQGARPRTRLQGRARQRHRAGLVRHRDQPRLSDARAGRGSPATFRSAASARTAISTARCCCWCRTPAATWPAPPWWSTAARWLR